MVDVRVAYFNTYIDILQKVVNRQYEELKKFSHKLFLLDFKHKIILQNIAINYRDTTLLEYLPFYHREAINTHKNDIPNLEFILKYLAGDNIDTNDSVWIYCENASYYFTEHDTIQTLQLFVKYHMEIPIEFFQEIDNAQQALYYLQHINISISGWELDAVISHIRQFSMVDDFVKVLQRLIVDNNNIQLSESDVDEDNWIFWEKYNEQELDDSN